MFSAAAFVAMVVGGIGGTAMAGQPSNFDQMKTALQRVLGPTRTIKSIEPTPVPGVFEVYTGKQLMYSDATGRYLFLGNIIDTETGKSYTAERFSELHRIDFQSLPLEHAFKSVHGNGARKISVFFPTRIAPTVRRWSASCETLIILRFIPS